MATVDYKAEYESLLSQYDELEEKYRKLEAEYEEHLKASGNEIRRLHDIVRELKEG